MNIEIRRPDAGATDYQTPMVTNIPLWIYASARLMYDEAMNNIEPNYSTGKPY